MRFVFKMFVLVGMILVGKFLKEDTTNEVAKKGSVTTGDNYSLYVEQGFPFMQQTKNVTETTNTKEESEETFTYSFN